MLLQRAAYSEVNFLMDGGMGLEGHGPYHCPLAGAMLSSYWGTKSQAVLRTR